MPTVPKPQFASHCDTELKFFHTEDEARGDAVNSLQILRQEANDGWDEETADDIVVLQVIARAEKIDPVADYRCVDYYLPPSFTERHYLIHVEGGTDPELRGPFESELDQQAAARDLRKEQDEEDALFWLDIDENGNPIVGSFTNQFFEPEDA